MFVFKVQLSHHLVLTRLGWRMIYIFFHRDDCIYNLICMLTPKKGKQNKRKQKETKKKKEKKEKLQGRCFAICIITVLHVLKLVSSLQDE